MDNNIKTKSNIIKEYFNREMVTLRKYLNLTIEEKKETLPYMFPNNYDIFSIKNSININIPDSFFDSPQHKKENIINNYQEFIDWLRYHEPDVFDSFATYLYKKTVHFGLDIPPSDYPAWVFFSSPKFIKNGWLIHFTNFPIEIARYGFLYGVSDHTKLGLTCHLYEVDKIFGGYNFAYDINNYTQFCYSDSFCDLFYYGEYAVIFNASGLKVWHYGDEEEQVIFYGNTAKNIIPIIKGQNKKFGVCDKNNPNKFYYEYDYIENVVDWILTNYHQYRNKIIWR